jgi:hypothetical protein
MPIDLGPTSLIGAQAPSLKKPPFLITLDDGVTGKVRNFQRFISLDKPQSENGFVQVKGIFCDKSEDEIIKSFSEILTSCPKELILEMMLPLHRIHSIRSLVFNAVKSITTVNVSKER